MKKKNLIFFLNLNLCVLIPRGMNLAGDGKNASRAVWVVGEYKTPFGEDSCSLHGQILAPNRYVSLVISILVSSCISTGKLPIIASYPGQNTCLHGSVYYDCNDYLLV